MIKVKPTISGEARISSALLPFIPGPSIHSAEANYYQASFPLTFRAIDPNTQTPNNAITPAGSEAIVLVYGRTQHAIQITGTFVGTVTVEATLDEGLNEWTEIDSVTAPDLKHHFGVYHALRVRITAYTSGNVVVSVLTQR